VGKLSISAPRPSIDHIDNILSWLEYGGYTEASTIVARYSGLPLNYPAAPMRQLLQTVLDPMDTLNYIDELDLRAYALSVADREDLLHGGAASWSLLEAIPRRQAVLALNTELSPDWSLYGISQVLSGSDPLENLQNGPLKILTAGGYSNERSTATVPAWCLPAVMGRANVSLTAAMRPDRESGCL
jgi:hypothetical protein